MATLDGNLIDYNLARIVVIDVSDDYEFLRSPMPSDFYPVLHEAWLPILGLRERIPQTELLPGYLYDWHEVFDPAANFWYVGVVRAELAASQPKTDPR